MRNISKSTLILITSALGLSVGISYADDDATIVRNCNVQADNAQYWGNHDRAYFFNSCLFEAYYSLCGSSGGPDHEKCMQKFHEQSIKPSKEDEAARALEVREQTINLPTGQRYTGFTKDNKFHGKGRLDLPNGDWYEGVFDNGAFVSGKVRVWKDGGGYEGESGSNKPNGFGKMTWKEGPAVSYERV